jgi:L-amino acid N-acyltransferase YncA
MVIRDAEPTRDALACARVYAPAVADGVASLEQRAPSPDVIEARMRTVLARYPWLVAEFDDEVVGYAYATVHNERWAYRWSTDTSVYVAPSQQRRGVGRALYRALLPLLVRQGLYVACAGITLPNPASVALHESVGFRPVGTYERVGFKHGSWWAVGWWLAQLRPQPDGETPDEPGAPARLNQPHVSAPRARAAARRRSLGPARPRFP